MITLFPLEFSETNKLPPIWPTCGYDRKNVKSVHIEREVYLVDAYITGKKGNINNATHS